MKALKLLVISTLALTVSCQSETRDFAGRWLPDDKSISSPIIIGQQNGSTICIIDSTKFPAKYDSDTKELIAEKEESAGCLRFMVTHRIKYLPKEKKLTMASTYGYSETPVTWRKYSQQH